MRSCKFPRQEHVLLGVKLEREYFQNLMIPLLFGGLLACASIIIRQRGAIKERGFAFTLERGRLSLNEVRNERNGFDCLYRLVTYSAASWTVMIQKRVQRIVGGSNQCQSCDNFDWLTRS